MKRTPLYHLHVQHGARMVDYAGWEMPLLFTGIVEEHLHTRAAASVFDVSHMGRIEIHGPDAEALLEQVCTRRLATAAVGQSRYSHVCNPQGGILDDVIVSRYPGHWLMVCNACNRPRMLSWLQEHAASREVRIQDITEHTLMIAVQGPAVMNMLRSKLPFSLGELKRYHFVTGSYFGAGYSIFRTGYTGEDGVEMILPASIAPLLGTLVGMKDDGAELKPAGLGARDTLRLEAGMPLYGHELTEQTDSISAGLAWCVSLDKDFIGAEALRRVAQAGPVRKLVGLELEGRRIARQGAGLFHQGREAGTVTSGTFSPSLQRSIAMAYVAADLAVTGVRLEVDLGGRCVPATVVPLPFLRRIRAG